MANQLTDEQMADVREKLSRVSEGGYWPSFDWGIVGGLVAMLDGVREQAALYRERRLADEARATRACGAQMAAERERDAALAVVRDLAALAEPIAHGDCMLCGGYKDRHAATCVWLRAVAATASARPPAA